MTGHTRAKAQRLITERKVLAVESDPTRYVVVGDTGDYVVRLSRAGYDTCSCPAHGPCSHEQAAHTFAEQRAAETRIPDERMAA